MIVYKMFLDDIRDITDVYPEYENDWIIAKDYKSAVELISELGFPYFISFDHDLGLNDDGSESNAYDLVKYLIDKMLDDPKIDMFDYTVHSANPIGAENITTLLDNFIKFRGE